MKIATYLHRGVAQVGVVDPDAGTVTPFDLPEGAAETGLNAIFGAIPASEGTPVALGEVTLTAPLQGPAQRVFCVGKNYYDHVQETEAPEIRGTVEPPKLPVIFSKWPQAIIGPGETIRFDPGVST
ncbi:MAG: fumarylacetoacetate hydrolase family protein, partial [Pseudomonadota bacterium]